MPVRHLDVATVVSVKLRTFDFPFLTLENLSLPARGQRKVFLSQEWKIKCVELDGHYPHTLARSTANRSRVHCLMSPFSMSSTSSVSSSAYPIKNLGSNGSVSFAISRH